MFTDVRKLEIWIPCVCPCHRFEAVDILIRPVSLTRGSVKSRTGLRSQKDKENISGPKSTMNGPHERNSIHDRGVVSPLFDTP